MDHYSPGFTRDAALLLATRAVARQSPPPQPVGRRPPRSLRSPGAAARQGRYRSLRVARRWKVGRLPSFAARSLSSLAKEEVFTGRPARGRRRCCRTCRIAARRRRSTCRIAMRSPPMQLAAQPISHERWRRPSSLNFEVVGSGPRLLAEQKQRLAEVFTDHDIRVAFWELKDDESSGMGWLHATLLQMCMGDCWEEPLQGYSGILQFKEAFNRDYSFTREVRRGVLQIKPECGFRWEVLRIVVEVGTEDQCRENNRSPKEEDVCWLLSHMKFGRSEIVELI
ncbi:hypothetical protein Dimus_009791 [Dionaea muscipula]